MLAEARKFQIEELLRRKNAVQVSELVSLFKVSAETVRRDLTALEEAGRLQRTHGGAISPSPMIQTKELSLRKEEFRLEKTRLARLAATFVQEGETIAIDSGSTAIHFTKALIERNVHLTVITHSLDVMNYLSKAEHIQTILCGGAFLQVENAFHGQFVLETLEKLHVDKSFIFPGAISLKGGLSDNGYELHPVQRQYIKMCDRAFFLADSSKFEKNARLKLDDLRPDYTLITDASLPEEIYRLYVENNVNIIRETKKESCK